MFKGVFSGTCDCGLYSKCVCITAGTSQTNENERRKMRGKLLKSYSSALLSTSVEGSHFIFNFYTIIR